MDQAHLPSIDCYVAMGANLGDRKKTLKSALNALQEHKAISSLRHSKFHETKAVSRIIQPNFLNAVCRFKCTLSINELFSYLEDVERSFGKRCKPKQAPRLIDLDLIFYGDHIYKSDKLTVPHPRWKERTFVLKPLAEVLCIS